MSLTSDSAVGRNDPCPCGSGRKYKHCHLRAGEADGPPVESFEQLAAATAAGLDRLVNQRAFELFRDKQFRRLARFDRLDQGEQDRIFNELVVAYLVLIILILEPPDLRVEAEFKEYLADLKAQLPRAHVAGLRELGIEAEHLDTWDKLITMRYEEYARDRHDVRAAAMQLEAAAKDLDLNDLAKIQLLVPVQAVAIGCHHHNCRGETAGRDDLFRYTLKALSKFYVEIRLTLEAGKITPLMRARVALRRLLEPR